MLPKAVASPHKSRAEKGDDMTYFDYCVVGFIPIAITLVLIELVLNDWDMSKVMFKEDTHEV
jgi:hypothetical protein